MSFWYGRLEPYDSKAWTSGSAALLPYAGRPCMSVAGLKYALNVSVSSQASGGQERQVSAPKRTYSVIPSMS